MTIQLSKVFGDKIVKFRIIQILKFKHDSFQFLLILGKDMLESGINKVYDIVFLIKIDNDRVKLIVPPFNLNYGSSNTQSFSPYYFNDFNNDNSIDFLQWNDRDSIYCYSILDDSFVLRKEFIKLLCEENENAEYYYYFDEKNSNWPYFFFKSNEKKSIKFPLENQVYDIENKYY